MKRIYLDHAATSPMIPEVTRVITEAMELYIGNPSSIHSEGRTARAKIEESRKKIARLLNASIGEIFFTSGGTEANNTAIKCAVRDLQIQRIISTPIEHHAVLHSIEAMRRDFKVEIVFLPLDAQGRISMSDLKDYLASSTQRTLVTIMHGNNEIGNLFPISEIALICEQYRAWVHTDAVQTIGHFPVNLQTTKVHFLAASAHKFNGPKGTGILFVRQGMHINPWIDGGGQERNFRAGTESTHQILGMATAFEEAYSHLEQRQAHHMALKEHFKTRILSINNQIYINGDQENALHHVLSVSFPPGPKSNLLLLQLDMAGISASGGSACTSGAEQESHVLQALGHPADRKTIRFSFSHLNTREEIDYVLDLLAGWFAP